MITPREDQPTAWFEELYRAADRRGAGVPWANMETHPDFRDWLRDNPLDGRGRRAVVVGCGMGDDALALEGRGFDVTAFDVSPTAIGYCRERFPGAGTEFVVADLFARDPRWRRRFDFVLEIYTVQSLPPRCEQQAIAAIADLLAPGGQLLAIALVDAGPRHFEAGPPWLLTPGHRAAFEAQGLRIAAHLERPRPGKDSETYVTLFERA